MPDFLSISLNAIEDIEVFINGQFALKKNVACEKNAKPFQAAILM